MSQAEFGPALGWSHRTAVRWERGRSEPTQASLVELASLLAPVDRDLAAEAAVAAGETLESLGLAAKPVEEKRDSRVTANDLADAVVCAVADETDLLPRALRPLLHQAFARARALGLTVEQVEEGLRARVDAKTDKGKERVRLRVRVAQEEGGEPANVVAGRGHRSSSR
jgi:hypothetical protein